MAIQFVNFLAAHNAAPASATQDLLERYRQHVGRTLTHDSAFIVWLRDSRTNTTLTIPTFGDHPRSDRLRHTALGGRRTPAARHDPAPLHPHRGFAHTAVRPTALTHRGHAHSQVTITDDQVVHVTFNAIPIEMPPLLDDLIRDHVKRRGKSLYASRDTRWLFPGGKPSLHLATENIRSQLVAIGIKPYENRKAALFQLAGDMPAPVLAELLGITTKNAADLAKLAAPRLDPGYIAERTR